MVAASGVDCRGWQLVVTGHSLGAGAAALCALYLHNYFRQCLTCFKFTDSFVDCSCPRAARAGIALGNMMDNGRAPCNAAKHGVLSSMCIAR